MSKAKALPVIVFILLSGVFSPWVNGEAPLLFREEFDSLGNWKPRAFPKIKEHSSYTIVRGGGESSRLMLTSRASASAMIFQTPFDVYDYPVIHWRWKVDNLYKKGDGTKKEGDDYPLRIYIIFKFDAEKRGALSRAKYSMAKLLYGEYPPDSTISFVWANRVHDRKIITSPFTRKAKIIPLNAGTNGVKEWQEHTVNIVSWYKKAFGKLPPKKATLGIMNDSDNTGESSVSYIDFIEISK